MEEIKNQISIATTELYRVFNEFNVKYFDSELIEPIIIIQSSGKHKNTNGWCTNYKAWSNEEELSRKFEITMTAEYLNRPIYNVMGTQLHEMIHLYCTANNIVDCSNNNRYHNKKFKEEAEKRGLIIEHAKTIGWSVTTLTEETKQFIDSLNIKQDAFKFFRELPIAKEKEVKGKSKTLKYECPTCHIEIKSKEEVKVLCQKCNVLFTLKN